MNATQKKIVTRLFVAEDESFELLQTFVWVKSVAFAVALVVYFLNMTNKIQVWCKCSMPTF